jgi:hypothetical protein
MAFAFVFFLELNRPNVLINQTAAVATFNRYIDTYFETDSETICVENVSFNLKKNIEITAGSIHVHHTSAPLRTCSLAPSC